MRTITLATAAAFIALANPASAQLLGGGLGGALGGMGGGSIGSSVSRPIGSITNDTVGSASGAGNVDTTHNVDRRSGKANAKASGSAQGNGSLTQGLTTPLSSASASGNGSGNASGSGSADAQLIGTDALRATAKQARDQGHNAVGGARDGLTQSAGKARDKAGSAFNTLGNQSSSAAGNAQGSGEGAFAGLGNGLALAGSAAGDLNGTFDVKPGMKLFDANGEKIGKIKQVVADQRGNVEALVVKVDGETATLPAANFTGSGSILTSAMGEGEIKQVASDQEAQQAQASGSGSDLSATEGIAKADNGKS